MGDSSLVASSVGHTRRIICASPAYLRRRGRPRAARELLDHDCVRLLGPGPAATWELIEDGNSVHVPVRGPMASNNLDAVVDACVRGLRCGRFFSYQVDDVRQGILREVLGELAPPPTPIHLVYPHAAFALGAGASFRRLDAAAAPARAERRQDGERGEMRRIHAAGPEAAELAT